MRRLLEVLLPVSILSFVLSYFYSCLPCYLHSTASLLHSLNHFATRKSLFLFSNGILLYLSIKGAGITTNHQTFLLINPFEDETHLITREDGHLMISDDLVLLEVEERIVEKEVICESVVVVRKSYGEFSASEPSSKGNDQLVIQTKAIQAGVDAKKALGHAAEEMSDLKSREEWLSRMENVRFAKGKRRHLQGRRASRKRISFECDFLHSPSKQMDALVMEEDLDLLDIDELNKRFDEFIEKEKRKRRSEAMQLILF